jgi:Putative peptidoglycan binding domain
LQLRFHTKSNSDIGHAERLKYLVNVRFSAVKIWQTKPTPPKQLFKIKVQLVHIESGAIMKTRFHWLALVIGAALAAPAQADDRHSSGNSAVASRAPARTSAASVRSVPRGNFGGGRPMMPAQRFSSIGMRSTAPAFRQYYVNPIRGALISRQFTSKPLNRTDGFTRFSNPGPRVASMENRQADRSGQIGNGNRRYVNPNGETSLSQRFASRTSNRGDGVTPSSNPDNQSGRFGNRKGDRSRQIENQNGRLNANREHVFARRSAGWRPDWDRNREHWWNGHRCRFVNGVWVIFDLGFYPWWPYGYGYPGYGYSPYDYYPSNYYSPSDYSYGYPYGYDSSAGYDPSGYNQDDAEYYNRGGAYNSSDQYNDRTIADAQTQLAKEGYYGGDIDGVLGPETRRAITSFQSDHGLRVTGNLTQETLSTLGL